MEKAKKNCEQKAKRSTGAEPALNLREKRESSKMVLLFPGRPPGNNRTGSKDGTGCNDETAQATGETEKTEDGLRGNGKPTANSWMLVLSAISLAEKILRAILRKTVLKLKKKTDEKKQQQQGWNEHKKQKILTEENRNRNLQKTTNKNTTTDSHGTSGSNGFAIVARQPSGVTQRHSHRWKERKATMKIDMQHFKIRQAQAETWTNESGNVKQQHDEENNNDENEHSDEENNNDESEQKKNKKQQAADCCCRKWLANNENNHDYELSDEENDNDEHEHCDEHDDEHCHDDDEFDELCDADDDACHDDPAKTALSFFGESARGNNTPPMEETKEFMAMTHQLVNDENCCFDNMKETNETIEFLKMAVTAVENDDESTSDNNTLVTMANEETNLNKTTNTNKKVTMENGNASHKQLVETCKVQATSQRNNKGIREQHHVL